MRSIYYFRMILLLAGLFVLAGHQVFAQSTNESNDAIAELERAYSELESVRASLQSAGPDENYTNLRTRAQDIAVIATSTSENLSPRLEAIDKTLESIGEPASGEAVDIKVQRADLARERDQIDSAVKRALLLATSARETVEAINRAVADLFNKDTWSCPQKTGHAQA